MAGAYGTPCSGELQFWSIMQSQMRELAKQTTRIANALEAQAKAPADPPPGSYWVTPVPGNVDATTVPAAPVDDTVKVLRRVHDFLGVLCRDGKCGEQCSACLDASDLADDVWDVLKKLEGPE